MFYVIANVAEKVKGGTIRKNPLDIRYTATYALTLACHHIIYCMSGSVNNPSEGVVDDCVTLTQGWK